MMNTGRLNRILVIGLVGVLLFLLLTDIARVMAAPAAPPLEPALSRADWSEQANEVKLHAEHQSCGGDFVYQQVIAYREDGAGTLRLTGLVYRNSGNEQLHEDVEILVDDEIVLKIDDYLDSPEYEPFDHEMKLPAGRHEVMVRHGYHEPKTKSCQSVRVSIQASFTTAKAQTPTGTAGCNGGAVHNPNPFPIEIEYTVDGHPCSECGAAAQSTQDIAYTYTDVGIHWAGFTWSGNGFSGEVDLGHFGPCGFPKAMFCTMTTQRGDDGNIWVDLGAVDAADQPVRIVDWRADSNFSPNLPQTGDGVSAVDLLPVSIGFPDQAGYYWVQFEVQVDPSQTDLLSDEVWLGGPACLLDLTVSKPPVTGQYQGFNGPVAFGPFTPDLEPGKEYFDMTQSLMYNVEYIDGSQGDIVFRYNGREVDHVVSHLFHGGDFDRIEPVGGRAVQTFDPGVTKLIAYRYGVEQARIFQTMTTDAPRWIHPLDQPFEHKYAFALELHGPPGATDRLVYNQEQRPIHYDDTGQVVEAMTFSEPGLVAVYSPPDDGAALAWVTVDTLIYPLAAPQTETYTFGETGLYHYRVIEADGQIVAGLSANPTLTFTAEPGVAYLAQLVYPDTSLFVGLYGDMQFEHPDYWLMPVDGRLEHEFEFHLDYHRQPDPDLGNDHLRGDVVVDGLTLSYGTTAVAQQFPYSRHDGARPGVNLLGIPDVSMVAFCQRPGYHEVVYWGGWENESYYLPERGRVYDEDLADEWNDDQRGCCIDAARRVNMELARQGLRTDHTYRHHGEQSQGYQMVLLHIWSPYNLAGMRPPHIGQFLKPGTTLPYYEDPEDVLFWGWDLERGGLAEGIGAFELQQFIATLGPAQYVDMTGIHPAEAVFVPDFPVAPPEAPVPVPTPAIPVQPERPATTTPTPEPSEPTPLPPPTTPQLPSTPTPTSPPPTITPTPKPPLL
ncbi:MAG: hypothetical protein KDJ97_37185 [Anaerolineae bacterium]|nr:hypothetical protein [Anaerolineae bacterium]